MTPRRATLPCLAVTSLLAAATPSLAQSDDDWDLAGDAGQDLTVASVEYATRVTVVAQCRSRVLEVAILGLPRAAPGQAWYDVRLSDGPARRASWTRHDDGTTLTAGSDPRLLRLLKGGGRLTLSADGGASTSVRLQVDLPASSHGLDAVLEACGYPTTNDRDLVPSVGELLTDFPRPIVPDRVIERRASPTFQVSISCLVSGGRYTACRSEHQIPPHPEDGQIVAGVVDGVRVHATDMAAAEGRVLDLVVTGSRTRRPRSGPGL